VAFLYLVLRDPISPRQLNSTKWNLQYSCSSVLFLQAERILRNYYRLMQQVADLLQAGQIDVTQDC